MNTNLYFKSILEESIYINLNTINLNLEKTILNIIKNNFEGKCSNNGYIKKDSIKLVSYSSGIISGNNIKFNIIFECFICYPTDGMIISCNVINVTKAGLRCELNENNSPLVVFVAKDHHYNNVEFNDIRENDIIKVKILGQRFELNDNYICVIAEFLEKINNNNDNKKKIKKKLKIIND